MFTDTKRFDRVKNNNNNKKQKPCRSGTKYSNILENTHMSDDDRDRAAQVTCLHIATCLSVCLLGGFSNSRRDQTQGNVRPFVWTPNPQRRDGSRT